MFNLEKNITEAGVRNSAISLLTIPETIVPSAVSDRNQSEIIKEKKNSSDTLPPVTYPVPAGRHCLPSPHPVAFGEP
jgi:hypothetical protein